MSEEKVKYNTSTIAEMTGGIILANFEKDIQVRETTYQSEADLERQMIENLVSQGYERLIVKSNDELYVNLKIQIEKLNGVSFTNEEWARFLLEYLDVPNDG
ncbi:Type I site-specific deoxyribonuclease, partial [human gut metagenome]